MTIPQLIFEVFDYNKIYKHIFLGGTTELTLTELIANPYKPINKEFVLKDLAKKDLK